MEYYVVKDKVRDQVINLEHISTERMLADPLINGLPPNMFREHVASLGLRESLKYSWTKECPEISIYFRTE